MTPRKSTEVRRAEIADAALHIVATRGIAALSTQALADAVGLTTGALFKHFPSRDAILLGLAERVVELLAATYPDAALPPLERLTKLAAARLSLVADSAGVLTLVMSEQFALAMPKDAARRLREAVGDTHRFAARAILDGQTDGSIRADVPADGLALLFLGAVQMTALLRRAGAAQGADHGLTTLHVLMQPDPPPESS
jgi:AcrR family transcriptional regulator